MDGADENRSAPCGALRLRCRITLQYSEFMKKCTMSISPHGVRAAVRCVWARRSLDTPRRSTALCFQPSTNRCLPLSETPQSPSSFFAANEGNIARPPQGSTDSQVIYSSRPTPTTLQATSEATLKRGWQLEKGLELYFFAASGRRFLEEPPTDSCRWAG
jgi:hypothetical protein